MAQARARDLPRLQPVILPAPRQAGGRPLLEVLAQRRSSREFAPRELDRQLLSDLLWAAFGINRPDGHRTAPSARNWQEIDIYVALSRGLYLFNPGKCRLDAILDEDIRDLTGMQDFVGTAPLNLVYVADLRRMDAEDRTEQRFYSAVDAGLIAENVYLFCASEGLETVVRGLVDRKALAGKMGLRPEQRVIVAQTIGFPQQR
ncbi:MAG: nitroreductase family protein [Hyphomicrobiales bacterium]